MEYAKELEALFIALFEQFVLQGANLLILCFDLLSVLDTLVLGEPQIFLLQPVILLRHLDHFGAQVV